MGLGVSHVTVGAQRKELEDRGQLDHVSETTDTLGRKQPRQRKPRIKTGYKIPNDKRAPLVLKHTGHANR